MPIRNNLNSRLDRIADGTSQTYGRASMMRKQVQTTRDLPTELVFADECTNDVFQLSYNGASQFLAKMSIPNNRQNVEWLIDNLLKMSIDDVFPVENDRGECAELVVSCKCPYDPQGRSLAQMGIAKSMVCKEPSMPPAQHQRMMKQDGVGTRLTESQMYMKKIGIPGAGEQDVLFGLEVVELSNALRKGTVRSKTSFVGHDDTSDIGGLVSQCNVAGTHRLKAGRGWQE